VDIEFHHSQAELSEIWCRLVSVANLRILENLKTRGIDLLGHDTSDLPPQLREWLDKAQGVTATEYLRDQEIRSHVYDTIQDVFIQYDLIVTPTLARLPVLNSGDGNTVGPRSVNGVPVNPLLGWCLTYPVNFSGHPAASIPAGLAAPTLPVGMQIIGRRYADQDVLTASAAFEQRKPWFDIYNICDSRPF
jgi:amidase